MKARFNFASLKGGVMSLMLVLSMAFATAAHAQDITVTGTVSDDNGLPVIGASVLSNNSIGTVTDLDGKYSISVPANAVLTYSSIGYTTVTVNVNGRKVIDVTLAEDAELLQETVVVGYGVQKKATLTGSVSSVGGEELTKLSATNVSNTLAGKTAGVIAYTRSGEPGADGATILIRGKGTLGDTSPLIVVDGIADRDFSRLNPEDIESISVLKDASAAIYGARAANGVILVTTKRGAKDGNVQMNYSGSYTMSQPTRVPHMLSSYDYATYVNEYDRDSRHGSTAATYSDEVLAHYKNGDDPLNFPSADWYHEVAKNWSGKTEHSFSVSGGSDRVSFYTSGQYMWQDAIYKNSAYNYNQYQFVSNVDAKVTDAVRFSLDVLGRQENRLSGRSSTDDIYYSFLTTFPGASAYYPNGLPRVGYDGVTNNAAVMVTDAGGTKTDVYRTLSVKPTLHIDLDAITPGLYAEGYAAMDMHFTNFSSLTHPFDIYLYDSASGEYINRRDATGSISVAKSASTDATYSLHGRIGYDHTFGDHHVAAFAAYEQSKYRYDYLYASRTNYVSTAIPEIFAGPSDKDLQSNDGSANAFVRQNVFGRVNYGYKDKYLFEATLRYDGSMNFEKGQRWGLFPSFSAGWVISEEPFYEPLKDVMGFFKIRASWGQMGNDNIAAYQYLTQYKYGDGDRLPNAYFYYGGVNDGTLSQGLVEARVANKNVTWETASTANLGFTAYFLSGKMNLDVDWFHSYRYDILCTRNASVPAYSGMTLPAENIGKVKNGGIEAILGYHDTKGDFNYGVTANFTYAKNTVVYMDEAVSTPEWQKQEGHPIDSQLLYKALGIYQTQDEIDNSVHIAGATPGDLWYEDINGDGEITGDDMIRVDYTATPRMIYGLTLNGGWKGLDLNVFFQGQGCAKQYLTPSMNMPYDFFEGRYIVGESAEYNAAARWPKACIKQTYLDDWNGRASTWWLRNAAFLRLKSVELGYTLPAKISQKMSIDRLRVYVNGSNLFTIDSYKVADPEVKTTAAGHVRYNYPLQRMVNFGVNISF